MSNAKKKVFVGMSGGVDSSVSAALLLEQGYDVTGVFIKVWQPDFIECTWKQDRLDALRVAAKLGIPFVTLDLEKEYKQGVIDYMIEEYRAGRTPNPDVMCNREVKFGAFWEWAKDQGADYIATGHYAQISQNSTKYPLHLVKSSDGNKDQTYFLWTLTSSDLSHTLFPVGGMQKEDVRKEAEKRGLATSTKKDSQGLCFVGTIDIKTLLKTFIQEEQGEVKNIEGETIGIHDGVTFYTIGERHGFTITKKSIDEKPYFIVAKDLSQNVLVVSQVPPQEIEGATISLIRTTWTQPITQGDVYEARARYRAPLAKVRVENETTVSVVEGDITAVKGQSLVLYDGDTCIGGGIIA